MKTNTMPPDSASTSWWQTATFEELGQAAKVLERFQARLVDLVSAAGSMSASSAPPVTPDQVARAILLRRFLDDDASLEGLLELADAAAHEVDAALSSGQDPRDDPAAVAKQRLLKTLHPVLLRCGQMLDAPNQDKAGMAARSAAETMRRLLLAYSLAPLRFGLRRALPWGDLP